MLQPQKQSYGPLGELTREEWKKLLESNEGLFKRCEASEETTGIVIDSEYGRGDGCKEVMYFVFHKATPEQQEFYCAIGDSESPAGNVPASFEYVLTLLGTIQRWKEDVSWLQKARNFLYAEETILHHDEELVQQGKEALAIHIPPVLKAHFPHIFRDIDFTGLKTSQKLEKISEVLHYEVEPKEKYLETYVKNL